MRTPRQTRRGEDALQAAAGSSAETAEDLGQEVGERIHSAALGLRLLGSGRQPWNRRPSVSCHVSGRVSVTLSLAAVVRAPVAPAFDPAPWLAGPMAPQRRGAPKTPEGSGVAECRRPSSMKRTWTPQEMWRKWLRATVLGACAMLTVFLLWCSLEHDDGVTEVLAYRSEVLPGRFIEVPCSEDYNNHRRFEGCSPTKCGRCITDTVITRNEAQRIRSIAEKGLSLGGSDGGASILDLHSGALSVGKHFVNLYRYFGDKIENIFSEEDFQLYRDVRQKVQLAIAQAFGISASSLHLTKPTFFSRINSTEARTAHDEYWHTHVDKVTYGSFDYTSLLYLSDYLDDFGGGRFVFMEEGANKTVEPRAGRVSFFTSGSENLHRVEKVRWGTRYAVTIAFTCNPDHSIADPAFT